MNPSEDQHRLNAIQVALTLHSENQDAPRKDPKTLVSDAEILLEFLKGGAPE